MKFMFKMLIEAICFPFVDKMAKRLLAHVALCAVLLVAASINMASACSCMMSHPQTQYCLADFGKNTKSLQCYISVMLLPLMSIEQACVGLWLKVEPSNNVYLQNFLSPSLPFRFCNGSVLRVDLLCPEVDYLLVICFPQTLQTTPQNRPLLISSISL